jgi:hypothetical protein
MEKRAFRRILDEGSPTLGEKPSSSDQTKLYEDKMAEIIREIEQNLVALSTLSDPPSGERVEKDVLQERLNEYINVELKETIEKLFRS